MFLNTPLTLVSTVIWLSSHTPTANAGWVNPFRPRSMGAPLSCVFCPPADELGFTLGDHSNNNGVLFCSYPAAPGENPNDFYCEYDSSTGTQRRDNDAGVCPPAASTTCDLSKRALALKRKPVAAQPQAAAVLLSIRNINAIRRLAARVAHRRKDSGPGERADCVEG
ncbi:hypothetical protein FRB98_001703 [Tulasnella sp. 332]|nr:hypothetical protein FRB98_001703 [Tulasnella sp. 332]